MSRNVTIARLTTEQLGGVCGGNRYGAQGQAYLNALATQYWAAQQAVATGNWGPENDANKAKTAAFDALKPLIGGNTGQAAASPQSLMPDPKTFMADDS